MTEREWLQEWDAYKMLSVLRHKGTSRQRRLFACAGCRRFWPLLNDKRGRQAVEVAELYADGLVNEQKLLDAQNHATAAWEAAVAAVFGPGRRGFFGQGMAAPSEDTQLALQAASAAIAVCAVRGFDPSEEIQQTGVCIHRNYPVSEQDKSYFNSLNPLILIVDELSESPGAIIRGLDIPLRDIFGNPFRPVTFDAAWRTPSVTAFAQAIYAERRFADMPILADALEVAGCTSADILDHCRSGQEHCRGCWVVDLVLEKG